MARKKKSEWEKEALEAIRLAENIAKREVHLSKLLAEDDTPPTIILNGAKEILNLAKEEAARFKNPKLVQGFLPQARKRIRIIWQRNWLVEKSPLGIILEGLRNYSHNQIGPNERTFPNPFASYGNKALIKRWNRFVAACKGNDKAEMFLHLELLLSEATSYVKMLDLPPMPKSYYFPKINDD